MPLALCTMLTWLVIGPVSERLDQIERRLRVEHLGLAGVLQRKPDLFAVRRVAAMFGQNGLSCFTWPTI